VPIIRVARDPVGAGQPLKSNTCELLLKWIPIPNRSWLKEGFFPLPNKCQPWAFWVELTC
jgi:hypothetical protein